MNTMTADLAIEYGKKFNDTCSYIISVRNDKEILYEKNHLLSWGSRVKSWGSETVGGVLIFKPSEAKEQQGEEIESVSCSSITQESLCISM